MEIKDEQILHKIIDFQSCIIEGRSLKALLHVNINFFLEKSGADIITIYMREHEKIKLEFILEKEKYLSHLLKIHVHDKKNFQWDKFLANLDKRFEDIIEYDTITHPYEIFKGCLSKKDTQAFNSELHLKNTVMMPIYNFNGRSKLGYVCFIFTGDNKYDIVKLKIVQKAIQTILQPLYNNDNRTMYSKCVRVDENMEMLTPQERRIVKIVLRGISYVEAAKLLNISINTLKTHMKNIFNKCNVSSKVELSNKFHLYK